MLSDFSAADDADNTDLQRGFALSSADEKSVSIQPGKLFFLTILKQNDYE